MNCPAGRAKGQQEYYENQIVSCRSSLELHQRLPVVSAQTDTDAQAKMTACFDPVQCNMPISYEVSELTGGDVMHVCAWHDPAYTPQGTHRRRLPRLYPQPAQGRYQRRQRQAGRPAPQNPAD